ATIPNINNGSARLYATSASGRSNPDFLLGGRTSASAECRHWSGRAVRWSSCAILLRRKTMLISFSTLVLASQLIITVADGIPNFNIERGCKLDSASAFDPNAGLNATIKRCADDEQKAKDQLQTQWSQFAPSDKKLCMGLTTN